MGTKIPDWDSIYQNFASLSIKRIESLAALNLKGRRILDVGCWWGWYIRYARERNAEVYGIDNETSRIKDAAEFLCNMDGLGVADAERIPYKADTFDAVFSYHVLEHIETDGQMIKEIYRILKRDGDLIIGVPNEYSLGLLPYRPIRWLLKHWESHLRKHGKYDWLKSISYSDSSHYREYTKKSLCKILSDHRFYIANIRSYGFAMPYPFKNRISKSVRVFLSRFLGPITPGFLREELILHARKIIESQKTQYHV